MYAVISYSVCLKCADVYVRRCICRFIARFGRLSIPPVDSVVSNAGGVLRFY